MYTRRNHAKTLVATDPASDLSQREQKMDDEGFNYKGGVFGACTSS